MSGKRVHQPVNRYEGTDTSNKWSDNEKRLLLTCLKKYGHTDILSISKSLNTKSITSIKSMINNLTTTAYRSKKYSQKPAIDMWIEQSHSDDTNALIPLALFYISLFEKRPEPRNCGGCDIRATYDYIYRMTRGHPVIQLPTQTKRNILRVVSKTISKMRLRSNENLVKFTNNLYKSAPRKDYTRKTTTSPKIGPNTVLQELNTFSVPIDQLRISPYND